MNDYEEKSLKYERRSLIAQVGAGALVTVVAGLLLKLAVTAESTKEYVIRIDERQANVQGVLEEALTKQDQINNTVNRHELQIDRNTGAIKQNRKDIDILEERVYPRRPQ